MSDLETRLDFANQAALEVQPFILEYFQNPDLEVIRKGDDSPVTVADRGAEERIRDAIAAKFPDDGILGEEFEEVPGKNGYRWVLDPIDGTKPFIRGVPLFGTLIGLERDGQCVLGVSRFPGLNEVVYGAEGLGAWWVRNDGSKRRAKVSAVSSPNDALFCTANPRRWADRDAQGAFDSFLADYRLTRGWADCYGHMLVATGRAEVMVDPIMSLWDAAALLPILKEAGGHFATWAGEERADGGDGVSVNAALRDDVMRRLR
ncbi:MAG: histidinol-phosphatase [Planctomycetota bacterium]